MKLEQHAETLIGAIQKATEEHGRPNSFSFGELHVFYGGPPPAIAGRAAREWVRIEGVTFEAGRAIVEELPKEALAYEPFIRVVSVGEQGARDFAIQFLGVPEKRIIKIEDGGPADRERYKPEARAFHIYLD